MRSTGRASKRMPLSPWSARTSFHASLDLAPVWKGSITRCKRNISSQDLEGWTIEDEGELEREGRVVFFLQSRHPFTGSGHEWTSGKMRIKAP
jgi:hypothetical protein